MWDLIVSVPDHCLSFYFEQKNNAYFSVLVFLCQNRNLLKITNYGRRYQCMEYTLSQNY